MTGRSGWLDMINGGISQHDTDMLKTMREKNNTLRDVYDSRTYYEKKQGRNTTMQYKQIAGKQLIRGDPKLDIMRYRGFLPNTHRDLNQTLTTFKSRPFPSMTTDLVQQSQSQLVSPLVTGCKFENILKAKDR